MLDLVDLARANERAFQAEVRTIDFRRQYHEVRTVERLERELQVARQRLSLSNPVPMAG